MCQESGVNGANCDNREEKQQEEQEKEEKKWFLYTINRAFHSTIFSWFYSFTVGDRSANACLECALVKFTMRLPVANFSNECFKFAAWILWAESTLVAY